MHKQNEIPGSLSFKGQATKHTTVKWSVHVRKIQLLIINKHIPDPPSEDHPLSCRLKFYWPLCLYLRWVSSIMLQRHLMS